MYDSNQINCDGSVDLCNTEDINAKMRACGWDVIDVEDGCYDVEGLVKALLKAKASTEKATFVNIRTIIDVGSKVAGDVKTHGAAFPPKGVKAVKKALWMNPDEHFVVSDEAYAFFWDIKSCGNSLEEDWNSLVNDYAEEYPGLYEEFVKRVEGRFIEDWRSIIPAKEALSTAPTPSRKSAGIICNPLAAKLKNLLVGRADLSPSVNMIRKDKVDFAGM
ncbi:transketolase [Fusarium oxysporum f. sp. pisi HDV247]|uniref:Transketolase n=1 Tax=Fusarium oxysporum f. sp. pisi HDV247 TaxID=1080344 RepID=W9NUR0_FUSOX|nr:transketolase [Fusarium oxysporum f. sp. pisi HDV247]